MSLHKLQFLKLKINFYKLITIITSFNVLFTYLSTKAYYQFYFLIKMSLKKHLIQFLISNFKLNMIL